MFVASCAPLLLVLHEPRLQIGKCCELNHDIRMLFLEHNENSNYNTKITEIKIM
jgi:hypothetical protein